MSDVLALLVYLGAFQYIVAFGVVALVGPKSWSLFRSIVATLLWPLFLIAFMVQVPVKAIRRRHMSSDQAIAIVEDYIDRHGSGAATQERARGLREIAERTSSINFWRGVLTDANATESEKIVAGQLLAQYFEVPEVVEKDSPKVEIRAMTEAQLHERALQEAAEILSDARHLPPDQDYVSQQKPPTEVAIPSAYPRLPQTCLKCLGTGYELGPDGRRPWMTCSRCAGDG